MLYSLTYGDIHEINWNVTKDKWNNSIITSDEIHQKLSIAKNLTMDEGYLDGATDNTFVRAIGKIGASQNETRYESKPDTDEEKSTFVPLMRLKACNIGEVSVISSAKNLTVSINANKKNVKNIMYLIVDAAKKVLNYELAEDVEIINTFRIKDKFVGAVLTFQNDEERDDNKLLDMYVESDGKYELVTIVTDILDDTNLGVKVWVEEITRKLELKQLSVLSKKYSKFSPGFKIKMNSPFLTKVYFVHEKYSELMQEKLEASGPDQSVVFTFDDDDIGEITEENDEGYNQYIVEAHNRALTLVGVNVPKDFCKKYKILYLFIHDPEKNTTVCVRSN